MKILPYGVRFYTSEGHFAFAEYDDDLVRLLFLAYQDRKNRPTIWVYDDKTGEHVRVHDFNYKSFSRETVENYLNERILRTDDLLDNVHIKW